MGVDLQYTSNFYRWSIKFTRLAFRKNSQTAECGCSSSDLSFGGNLHSRSFPLSEVVVVFDWSNSSFVTGSRYATLTATVSARVVSESSSSSEASVFSTRFCSAFANLAFNCLTLLVVAATFWSCFLFPLPELFLDVVASLNSEMLPSFSRFKVKHLLAGWLCAFFRLPSLRHH